MSELLEGRRFTTSSQVVRMFVVAIYLNTAADGGVYNYASQHSGRCGQIKNSRSGMMMKFLFSCDGDAHGSARR
jgi:hypothetical protein